MAADADGFNGLPPMLPSDAARQVARRNNEIVRLKMGHALSANPGLCATEVSVFPVRSSTALPTPISMLPKFQQQSQQSTCDSGWWGPNRLPYSLPSYSAQRYFVSGYSGHVPQLRFVNGAGFPAASHVALDAFDARQQRRRRPSTCTGVVDASSSGLDVSASPPMSGRLDCASRGAESNIYRRTEGLVPHYRGFVPGQKFRFGGPYGRITVNARCLP